MSFCDIIITSTSPPPTTLPPCEEEKTEVPDRETDRSIRAYLNYDGLKAGVITARLQENRSQFGRYCDLCLEKSRKPTAEKCKKLNTALSILFPEGTIGEHTLRVFLSTCNEKASTIKAHSSAISKLLNQLPHLQLMCKKALLKGSTPEVHLLVLQYYIGQYEALSDFPIIDLMPISKYLNRCLGIELASILTLPIALEHAILCNNINADFSLHLFNNFLNLESSKPQEIEHHTGYKLQFGTKTTRVHYFGYNFFHGALSNTEIKTHISRNPDVCFLAVLIGQIIVTKQSTDSLRDEPMAVIRTAPFEGLIKSLETGLNLLCLSVPYEPQAVECIHNMIKSGNLNFLIEKSLIPNLEAQFEQYPEIYAEVCDVICAQTPFGKNGEAFLANLQHKMFEYAKSAEIPYKEKALNALNIIKQTLIARRAVLSSPRAVVTPIYTMPKEVWEEIHTLSSAMM